ncbi:hypothetical protein JCM8202_000752 [Rhodotorula sphaerocarpa]
MSYGVPDIGPFYLAPQDVATYANGPAQAGYSAQILLLGVFSTLFGSYAASGELRRHRALGRFTLWLSLALNWVYTGLCFWESWIAAVSQNRTVHRLASGDIAWQFLPLLAGIIGVVTQAFLTSHALLLLPHRSLRLPFCAWMGALIAAQLTGATAACVNGVLYVKGRPEVSGLSYNRSLSLWLWASAAADLSISAVCCYSIRKRLVGFARETDPLIVKLVVIAFRTAAYTSLMSVIGAVLASTFSADFDLRSFTGFAFWLCQPGLYGIALFTFSRSNRRVVDNRSRFEPTRPTSPTGATKPEVNGERRPSRPTLSPSSSEHSTTPRSPLEIRVHRERVVSVEEHPAWDSRGRRSPDAYVHVAPPSPAALAWSKESSCRANGNV